MVEPTKTGGEVPQAHELSPELRHEPVTSDVRRVVRWFVGLGVLIALSLALCAAVLYEFSQRIGRTSGGAQESSRAQPMRSPGPGLQFNSPDELQKLRAREDELLGTAEWIDRERGVARIPIEEAMRIVVERGGGSSQGKRKGTEGGSPKEQRDR